MKNYIFLVRNAIFFDIEGSIAVFKKDVPGLGNIGLNSSDSGRNLVDSIVDRTLVLSENACVINGDNAGASRRDTFDDKCGVYMHGDESYLAQLEAEYKKFTLETKKFEMKARANRECSPPIKTKFVELITSGEGDLKARIREAANSENVNYLTIWPKYWDGYGEHFYIYSESEEKMKSAINDLLKKCSDLSIELTELSSINELPIE